MATGGNHRGKSASNISSLLTKPVSVKQSGEKQVNVADCNWKKHINAALYWNLSRTIKDLTPVQKYAIPEILKDSNVMACSFTGSGKTAAFLVPVINNILSSGRMQTHPSDPAKPMALILAPTRELAIQIRDEAAKLSQNTEIQGTVHLVCGGKSLEREHKMLKHWPCNIVVATVGRLHHSMEELKLSLQNIKYFVLDEADEMLSKGFCGEIMDIVKECPEDRVSVMFSATYPNAVKKVAQRILGSFTEILVGEDGATAADSIYQKFELVERAEKDHTLRKLMTETPLHEKILVFVANIPDSDRIASFVESCGETVALIHSELDTQKKRELALHQFVSGQARILVATSVAARGLDIPDVSIVVNYDMPERIEEYVLRIGRTGRLGRYGRSVGFFEFERDGPLAHELISSLKRSNQVVPHWMYTVKSKMVEDECRYMETYNLDEFTKPIRTYNTLGSCIEGIPLPCEAVDDTWD